MSTNLMRFQLPGNWAVCYNSFGDEEMVVEDGWIKNFHYYKEDLLWLQSMRRAESVDIVYELDPAGWLIDIGWYPDSDPTGTYRLTMFRDTADSDNQPHPAFFSVSRSQVVAVLEYLVCHICPLNEPEPATRQRIAALQAAHDQGRLIAFLQNTYIDNQYINPSNT